MRIPSGKTDQKIFFVAVDATDLVTRETGLATWTVYRSRNGGTATAYTTPTIAELSSANMPGVYCLTVDEDTTIASGSDSEEYCVHITHSGMAPVTRTIELYRRDTTTGNTAAVDSSGRVTVGAIANDAITAAAIAADAIGSSELAASAITEIQAGLSTLDAAGIRTAVGLASANLDTQLTAIDDFLDTEIAAIKAKTDNLPTDPADASDIAARFTTLDTNLATVAGYLDTEIAAIKAKTDNLPASPAATGDIPSAATIADAVWDEAIAGHAGAGSTGEALSAAGSAGDPWATALPGAYGAGTAGKIVGDNINATISSRATQTSVDTIDDFLDTEIAAIKAKTDNLPADPAASSDIPTADANADALLDRANGIETGYTPRQALRIMSAVLGGKSSGHPGSPVYRNLPDTADRVAATVSSGNRSAVTLTP